MNSKLKGGLLAALLTVPAALNAQLEFGVGGRTVQVHSFASQGFAYTGQQLPDDENQ